MRHYELVVVLSPMINPGQVTEAWDRIKGFITGREADINHEERWGTRRLAYPIRKGQYQFLEGNYHITRFSTEQPFNRELETFLRLDDNVLRSMVIATLPEDQLAAQAAAQARAVRTPPPRPVPAEGATPAAPATEAAAGAAPAAVAEAPAASAWQLRLQKRPPPRQRLPPTQLRLQKRRPPPMPNRQRSPRPTRPQPP